MKMIISDTELNSDKVIKYELPNQNTVSNIV